MLTSVFLFKRKLVYDSSSTGDLIKKESGIKLSKSIFLLLKTIPYQEAELLKETDSTKTSLALFSSDYSPKFKRLVQF